MTKTTKKRARKAPPRGKGGRFLAAKKKKKKKRSSTRSEAAPRRSAKKRAASSPTKKRSAKRRAAPLAVGDFVKLLFAPERPLAGGPDGERMWVVVTASLGAGRYVGALDSRPLFLRGLRPGQQVTFERRQVLATMRGRAA